MPYFAAASRALFESRRDRATTLQFWASVKPGIRRRTACKPKPAIPKRIIIGLTVLVLKRHSTFVLHARKMTPRGRSLCDSVLPLVIALRGVKSEATGDTEKHEEHRGRLALMA